MQPRKAEVTVLGDGGGGSGFPVAKSGAGEVLRLQAGSIWRHPWGLTSSDPGTTTHTDLVVN